MAAAADKFARLAALKPTRPLPARPAAIRTPGEEDVLGRLLGAGVASNPFGEHLAVRNWFSTPEFSEPSSTTLELLSRTRDESIARKTRAALEDPERDVHAQDDVIYLIRQLTAGDHGIERIEQIGGEIGIGPLYVAARPIDA